jgi:hypothetical protein
VSLFSESVAFELELISRLRRFNLFKNFAIFETLVLKKNIISQSIHKQHADL